MSDTPTPLAFLGQGDSAKIVSIDLSADWRHRLAEMGLVVGELITAKQVKRGSLIIEHKDSQWVLGRSLTSLIQVSPIGGRKG